MNDQYNQLVSYIHQQVQQGVPAESIHQALLAANWDPAVVGQAMAQLGISQQPQPNQTPSENTAQYPNQTQFQTASDLPHYPQTNNYEHEQPAVTDAPKKYRVWQAIADTFKAIKHNPVNIIVSIIVSLGITYGLFTLLVLAFAGVLAGSSFGPLGGLANGVSGFGVVIGFLVLALLISTLGSALFLSLTAQSLYDGAERQAVPLKQTLKRGLRGVFRMMGASFVSGVVILGPMLAMALFGVMYIAYGKGSGNSALILFVIPYIVTLMWACIAIFRFALAPFVALFEPEVPLRKTLGRSSHLLRKGGQWFIFKGFLLMILVTIIIAVATGQKTVQDLQTTTNLVANSLLAIASIIMVGALVMLYRNRRAVRG